jgi:WD40 repeat protein/tRNA A-37 threonylcarbamoyl transferase component Bud32
MRNGTSIERTPLRFLVEAFVALRKRLVGAEGVARALNGYAAAPGAAQVPGLVDLGLVPPENAAILEAGVEHVLDLADGDPADGLRSLLDDRGPGTANPGVVGESPAQPGQEPTESAEPASECPASAAGDVTTDQEQPAAGALVEPGGALGYPGLQIESLLARGGLGEVYVAHDEALNRDVAVKFIHPERADHAPSQARFRLEVEITGGLEHPGIVPVYSAGQAPDGRPFYTMRLVRGSTLKHAIRRYHNQDPSRRQPLEFRQLLNHFVRVCDIVSYAHSRCVLHRDLKPSNIMLGKYGETLVVDWGLAKSVGQPEELAPDEMALRPLSGSGAQATVQGMRVGTPQFMSPEQAAGRGEELAPTTDVYSLGATLYMILTGKPPLADVEDPTEILERVVAGTMPAPRALAPNVPRVLENMCRKAMALHPSDRYASAQALGSDIEHWLADEPVEGVREDFSHRLWRWERRYRNGLRVAVVALVALAALATASAFVIDRAREDAERRRIEATEAKHDADTGRDAARRLSTRLMLDRGLSLLDRQEARTGLLWMTRALNLAGDPEVPIPVLDRAIRANLAAWSPSIHRLEACLVHKGPVRVVAVSPRGDLFATTGQDGIIQVWDGNSGQRIGPPLKHSGQVRVLRFSSDAALLASGSDDCTARTWAVPSGAPLGEPMSHDGPVVDLAFSPDGTRLVTASQDGSARFWNVNTGAAEGEPLIHDASPLARLALSCDGRWLACVTRSGRIRLWELPGRDGRWLTKEEMDPPPPVRFTPDGKRLATANRAGQPLLIDLATGRVQDSGHRSHAGPVHGLVLTPDGQEIVTCGYDTACVRWRIPGWTLLGSPLEQVGTMRQRGYLWDLALSPDGTRIATASDDNSVQIWDRLTGSRVGDPLPHTGPVRAVKFLAGGRNVLTGCDDGYARLWRLGSDTQTGQPMTHSSGIFGLAVRPDGQAFATATQDGFVWLWDTATSRLIAKRRGHQAEKVVRELEFTGAWSPNPLLVTGGEDGRVRFWNAETLAAVGPVIELGCPPVRKIAISPDGRLLAVGDNAGRLGLWNLVSFETLLDPSTQPVASPVMSADGLDQITPSITSLAFNPKGTWLAVGKAQGEIQLWDVGKRAPAGPRVQMGGSIRMLRYSPDGSKLASGSVDKTAQIWNGRTLEPIGPRLIHDGAVWSVQFSPESGRLVTASFDGMVRLWDSSNGRLLGEPMRHEDMVYGASFTGNGARLVTYGRSRAVRVWDAATLLPVGPPLQTGSEVFDATVLPGDQRIVTAGRDGTARLWQMPAPTQGNTEQVIDEVHLLTGMEFGPSDVIQVIPADRWLSLRDALGR